MTVDELIDKLKNYDGGLEVKTLDPEYGAEAIDDVRKGVGDYVLIE